jgi:hypothetical protein
MFKESILKCAKTGELKKRVRQTRVPVRAQSRRPQPTVETTVTFTTRGL